MKDEIGLYLLFWWYEEGLEVGKFWKSYHIVLSENFNIMGLLLDFEEVPNIHSHNAIEMEIN